MYSIPESYKVSSQGGGAAIAPPPSLGADDGVTTSPAGGGGGGGKGANFSGIGSTIAAKIMAKYGFKVC